MNYLKSSAYYDERFAEVLRDTDIAFDCGDIDRLNELGALEMKISGLITLATLREKNPDLFTIISQTLNPNIGMGI